ncbi:MAG: hypothetical protein JO225_03740, partial [Candidatus Eremiobacteraeota bacterium]|nr:hypothetical protein [Candidatus Eremiobacteraeota bacterium]
VARVAFSGDGRRLIVVSPTLSDTPDAVQRVAVNGDVLDTWDPVAARAPYCDRGDGFRFAVPLAVRDGDDVLMPNGSCGDAGAGGQQPALPTQLWNVPTKTAVIRYAGSTGTLPLAFDADRSNVAAIGFDGVLRIWATETGELRAQGPTQVPISSDVAVGLAVGPAYLAVVTSPASGFEGNAPWYALTLVRIADATPVASARGDGALRDVDVLPGARVGVVTDRGVDVWSLP